MTSKRKRDEAPGTPIDAGNTGSAENVGSARPWTDEEMAAAKPLPLPTVDTQNVRPQGTPYVGKGETKPGGRPAGNQGPNRK
jgi:hypothetical protein